MTHEQVPPTLSIEVLRLCQKITQSASPEFITITPEPGCLQSDCFKNVKEKVEKEGGRIQFGWAIWEWPGVFIEAEHHAVYEPSSGRPWQDITPGPETVAQRLFLPDDGAAYDFANEGFRRDNVRLALVDDPDIEEFFLAAKRRNEYVNSLPGIGLITIHAVEDKLLKKLERRLARATAVLEEKYSAK